MPLDFYAKSFSFPFVWIGTFFGIYLLYTHLVMSFGSFSSGICFPSSSLSFLASNPMPPYYQVDLDDGDEPLSPVPSAADEQDDGASGSKAASAGNKSGRKKSASGCVSPANHFKPLTQRFGTAPRLLGETRIELPNVNFGSASNSVSVDFHVQLRCPY